VSTNLGKLLRQVKKVRELKQSLQEQMKLSNSLYNSRPSVDVFTHNQRGSHYDNKLLNRIWKTACEANNIKIGLYEGVRHSFGHQMRNKGYPLSFIQAILHHTSSKTTERYAHLDRSLIAEAIENRGQVIELRKVKNE